MLAKGSNSGVYLQGLYEMQIFDSWGSTEALTTSDVGAIYHQWIDNRGVGGSAPRVNAARRPGEWQTYQAWFRAPRFDAAGKKTAAGTFPARAAERTAGPERRGRRRTDPRRARRPGGAAHPLMLPGRPRAGRFRNIHVRPLRPIVVR